MVSWKENQRYKSHYYQTVGHLLTATYLPSNSVPWLPQPLTSQTSAPPVRTFLPRPPEAASGPRGVLILSPQVIPCAVLAPGMLVSPTSALHTPPGAVWAGGSRHRENDLAPLLPGEKARTRNAFLQALDCSETECGLTHQDPWKLTSLDLNLPQRYWGCTEVEHPLSKPEALGSVPQHHLNRDGKDTQACDATSRHSRGRS